MTGYVPAASVDPAVSVSVDVAPLTSDGENVAPRSAGLPAGVRPTLPENPPERVTVTVAVVLPPWAMLTVVGATEREYDPAAGTVTLKNVS